MSIHRRKWIVVILICLLLLSVSHSKSYAFGEGSQGPDVFAVQGMLKSLGFYAGPIDGIYGPLLRVGVTYFQQVYGLQQTGAVNKQTLESILWAYGELKINQVRPPNESAPGKQPGQAVPQLSHDELTMVQLVNQEREKAGLAALQVDVELARVARIKSEDMIQQNYFSHQSPTYGSPFEMMRKFAIRYTAAAENIACNQNVRQAHKALMESQGHRDNILSGRYTHIGVGIVNGGICGQMYTQMFIAK